MRKISPAKLLLAIFFIGLIAVIMAIIPGCTSTKDLHQEKYLYDSTALKLSWDSNRVLRSELSQLESENRELKYAGVIFDTTYLLQHDTIHQVVNVVKISPDGGIEASGKIKSAYFSRDIMSRQLATLQKKYDSMSASKRAVSVNLKTEVTMTDLHKKTSLLPWWIWLMIGAAGATALLKWKSVLSFLRG